MHWVTQRDWFIHHRRRLMVSAGLLLVILFVLVVQPPGRTELVHSYESCAHAGYGISQTNPPVCHGPKQDYVGPAVADVVSNIVYKSQPFTTYVNGDTGNTYPRGQKLITNQGDWEVFWRQVHAGLSEQPPILNIDFSKNDVMAVTNGQQPTQGYVLKITAVLTSPAGSMVDVVEQYPTVTCQVDNHPSNRYYIATTAKLTQPVSFRMSTTPKPCGN